MFMLRSSTRAIQFLPAFAKGKDVETVDQESIIDRLTFIIQRQPRLPGRSRANVCSNCRFRGGFQSNFLWVAGNYASDSPPTIEEIVLFCTYCVTQFWIHEPDDFYFPGR